MLQSNERHPDHHCRDSDSRQHARSRGDRLRADVSTQLLFDHSRRVFLWASLQGEKLGLAYDPELLYVGAMFHDVGLVEGHRSEHERFEIDGAKAAHAFLERPDARRAHRPSSARARAPLTPEPGPRGGSSSRTGVEVAVFVTRKSDAEVLIVHRSPEQGGYWHIVAGGVEPGESTADAAERELHEETGLVAKVTAGVEVIEYVYPLTEQPAARRNQYDPAVVGVQVTCFSVSAPDDWEPDLDWEHDDHRWCSPAEAFHALRWPETANALRKLFTSESR